MQLHGGAGTADACFCPLQLMPKAVPRTRVEPPHPVRQELLVIAPMQRRIAIESGRNADMIKWAIIFFVISVVAGLLGFTGVASGTRTIAKVLFFIAIVIFLIVLVFGVMLGKLVF